MWKWCRRLLIGLVVAALTVIGAGPWLLIVAWPTGRDGRELFASSALLSARGKLLAAAPFTSPLC